MKHLHIFRGNRNTNTFCVSTLYHINIMLSSIILTYTIYFLIASLLLPLSLETKPLFTFPAFYDIIYLTLY